MRSSALSGSSESLESFEDEVMVESDPDSDAVSGAESVSDSDSDSVPDA